MKWYNFDLSQDQDIYPFLKFFSHEFEVTNENEASIDLIGSWLAKPNDKGLLIIGAPESGKSHLLYSVACNLGIPIRFANEIVEEALSTFSYQKGDDKPSYRRFIDHMSKADYVIDDLGLERTSEKLKINPISDIIEEKWRKGKGIIAASNRSKKRIKDTNEPGLEELYGSEVVRKMLQASETVLLKPR